MSKKSEERAIRFTALSTERDELESSIDGMIADMAATPEDERRVGEWAADGASTQRYLTLTERLAEVEHDLVDLSRAMAADADEAKPN